MQKNNVEVTMHDNSLKHNLKFLENNVMKVSNNQITNVIKNELLKT